MGKTIKVNSIKHAVEIIFYENLESTFEREFGELPDGMSFNEFIVKNEITLTRLVMFLNDWGYGYYIKG